jgi:isocitrate dehydrogenase (NAD+)
MFDPAGGTAPDIAGRDRCNPAAVLLAFGMLLDHIDRYDLAHALRLSLLECIAEGVSTADVGGTLGTREFTETVVNGLVDRLQASH